VLLTFQPSVPLITELQLQGRADQEGKGSPVLRRGKKKSPETVICSIDEPVVSAGAPQSSRNLIRGGSEAYLFA
jgi:hypothetical protein